MKSYIDNLRSFLVDLAVDQVDAFAFLEGIYTCTVVIFFPLIYLARNDL